MPIGTDDFVSVQDFFGRYCWYIDEGDADAWLGLWAEDGEFTGLGAEVRGHAALRVIPTNSGRPGGPMRHTIANLHCDYAEATDKVIARYYNMVTHWETSGAFTAMAMSTVTLRRNGKTWLIERSDTVMLPAKDGAAN